MKNKFVAFILTASLVMTACFTGCGKEEVDYNIENDYEDTYNYTPVWILTQRDDGYFEEYEYYTDGYSITNNEENYSELTIIVNAMDGTIYNIDDIY